MPKDGVVTMKKKKYKTLKEGVIGGIIGFILGFSILFIRDRIQIPEGFVNLPLYISGIIFVFTFVLAVTLHEFGHALSFISNGIKIRAVFFTIFALIKEDNKWNFKVTSMKTVGGIAIPDIISIKNKEDFQLKQKAFAQGIIMGPISSLIAWIVLTFVSLVIIKFTSNIYIRSVLLSFILSLSCITIFILGTSFIKKDLVIGDFPAYKIVKNDSFFSGIQFYGYGYLSSQPEKARDENTYLREYIIKELEEKYRKKDSDLFTLSIIDTIIVEYFAGFLENLPTVVESYVNFISTSPEVLSKIRSSVMLETLYFHIIMLLHRDESTREKSFELYKNLKDAIEPNTPKRKYLFKQVEQVLGIRDNKEYLMDRQNIITSDAHQIYKYFYGYYMDEIKINEMI